MSFASVAELATYLGRTFSAGAETTQAQQFLDLATAEIQGYTARTLSQMVDDVATLDADDRGVLVLPDFPVSAVSAVTVDGVALVVADDVYWYADGRLLRRACRTWGWKPQSVVVTYTHGYATIPDDIKSVCLAMAAERLQGAAGTTADAEGNPVTVSQVRPAAGLHVFTDQETDVLSRYRMAAVA